MFDDLRQTELSAEDLARTLVQLAIVEFKSGASFAGGKVCVKLRLAGPRHGEYEKVISDAFGLLDKAGYKYRRGEVVVPGQMCIAFDFSKRPAPPVSASVAPVSTVDLKKEDDDDGKRAEAIADAAAENYRRTISNGGMAAVIEYSDKDNIRVLPVAEGIVRKKYGLCTQLLEHNGLLCLLHIFMPPATPDIFE